MSVKLEINMLAPFQVHRACERLLRQLDGKGRDITAVYGIPQDGIPFAMYIAGALRVPLVSAETVRKYPSSTLVVNDVYDTGETLENWLDSWFRGSTPPANIAVVYDKGFAPDGIFYGQSVTPNTWLIFPWEDHNPTNPNQLEGSSKYRQWKKRNG